MQTFLPYPDFERSAQCLDMRRLGKQRVEAWQIYNALNDETNGWHNHPAVRMWRGYDRALLWYGVAVCDEWVRRGYQDTMKQRFVWEEAKMPEVRVTAGTYWLWEKYRYLPNWLGRKDFHMSHMSNLLRKKENHYRVFFGGEVRTDLPYVWPVGGGADEGN